MYCILNSLKTLIILLTIMCCIEHVKDFLIFSVKTINWLNGLFQPWKVLPINYKNNEY